LVWLPPPPPRLGAMAVVGSWALMASCIALVGDLAAASVEGPGSIAAVSRGTAANTTWAGASVEALLLGHEGTLREAFANSFAMIIVTELGDKTFFIAAVLAMRHSRRAIFLGATGALATMTVLSSCIGLVVPALMSPEYTHWAATALFLYFGLRHLYEACDMVRHGKGSGPSEELVEVEHELQESKSKSSVAVQALTLTFVAEWGDRSQIATIALAAAKEPWGVTLGGIAGHSCCTGVAVLGGRMLASRISERLVLGSGGVLFLAFALHGILVRG